MTPGASISTVLVRPLTSALGGTPAALEAFFGATDLTPEMVADADARISPAQFCVAWSEATRLSGDPLLALRIAAATPPGAFGIVEYVCRSAPTLRDALGHWVRYLGILDDAVGVTLIDEGHVTSLRVTTESEAPAPASHELCFALVARHARAMVGKHLTPRAVRFTHHVLPAHAARHRDFFQSPVQFGAAHTELVFSRESLATPLETADPGLLAILLPPAEAQRRRERAHFPLTEQVRRALRAALTNDDAQLESIAKRLGLTGRSLQRRLKDEDTSFQALREGMRRELADVYLGRGLSISEVSFLLGFSEPSAFFRAFKRWTGLTPFERRTALSGARP